MEQTLLPFCISYLFEQIDITCTIPQELHPYVKSVLSFQQFSTDHQAGGMPFFPDGCPGIMYVESETDVILHEKKLSSLFLYGQTIKPINIHTYGRANAVIFILYPHLIRSLFGIRADELRDNCIDFELLPFPGGKYVKEQLLASQNTENRIEVMSRFLLDLITRKKITMDESITYATSRLTQSKGDLSLKALRTDIRVSERTFERKFREHVGISPRLYARICRFRSAMMQLQSEDYSRLSDIAYDNGYADQSHFIRTFQEFTGYTPTGFLAGFTRGS
ncbi:helix-turn-helix domain-containing protein [Sinomicrobium weinanense]|uniref:Helix-turn-helix transcriptional regulator n=1 Tax=Sinomicrobium weinanense TaxID=2842200 RepID=A0A926JRH3_9FLAO|nr:helix-turn-helix transcriptional regulator [Sinomicrobium weinanense]MBC9795942.1 helix-turn-helix transcriptional regulator [Sinomicrobium weinanense]MBU3122061.1 helix-turn-helix transcriptional regulator [Sinomicrobium weinanense]